MALLGSVVFVTEHDGTQLDEDLGQFQTEDIRLLGEHQSVSLMFSAENLPHLPGSAERSQTSSSESHHLTAPPAA